LGSLQQERHHHQDQQDKSVHTIFLLVDDLKYIFPNTDYLECIA
jgi:hypothetical protein